MVLGKCGTAEQNFNQLIFFCLLTQQWMVQIWFYYRFKSVTRLE